MGKERVLVAWLVLTMAGCSPNTSSKEQQSRTAGTTPHAQNTPQAPATPDERPAPPAPSPYDALPPPVRELLDTPFTGDLDAMVKRRLIRAGVVFNRTHYFIDRGVQRGAAYESITLFEEELNKRLKTGRLKVHVAFVPLARDQLFPALLTGKVDFVAASLTVTSARQALANFSAPLRSGVSEIVVTADDVAPVATPEDLSGREVFVRRSSSYYDSVQRLNETLSNAGQKPVTIKEAPEALEDDDILEMVNAGLVDLTIVDDFLVDFWRQVFTNIHPQTGAAVRTGGEIAVGVRRNNPLLLRAVNTWIKEYGPRTTFGNTMGRRYLQNASYVKNANSTEQRRKFAAVVELFKKYGAQYDLDYLLMTAQGFQESRLDHSAKSAVGAVGIMQVMPATGKSLKVGDINLVEPNIHAGVKYFRFMMDEYYKDEPMREIDKALMTFASYNAGPNRVRGLRNEAARRGLDPNVWFGNVERIASEQVGRETVDYVSNIYKYYVAYRLAQDHAEARARARTR